MRRHPGFVGGNSFYGNADKSGAQLLSNEWHIIEWNGLFYRQGCQWGKEWPPARFLLSWLFASSWTTALWALLSCRNGLRDTGNAYRSFNGKYPRSIQALSLDDITQDIHIHIHIYIYIFGFSNQISASKLGIHECYILNSIKVELCCNWVM